MIFYELFKYMQSKITDLLWLWLFLSLSVLIALLRSLRSSHIHMRSVNSSISFCDYSMRKRWKQQMMKKKISVDGINYNDWNRKLNSTFLLQLFGTLNERTNDLVQWFVGIEYPLFMSYEYVWTEFPGVDTFSRAHSMRTKQ